ncbi:MAG: asparagine synthase-related protein [Dehalococcoidia bacterium]|jgi:asparagine synthase (glutamine-hydrolysing)|nr:asparagine synthase-related protein [Dehalococcoidia bacterium]
MCGIAGVVSADEEDVAPSLRLMLNAMRHRGPDGAGYLVGNKVCRADNIDGLDWENAHGPMALGHTRLAVVGGAHGSQPFVCNGGPISLLHNGEIYNYQELRPELEGKHNFATATDSEVLAHLIGEIYAGNLTAAVEAALKRCDGVYAIAVTDGKQVVIGRDLVGVRQLYVGKQGPLFAFASEKKALWALGIKEGIRRLLPGQLSTISANGVVSSRQDPNSLIPDDVSISDAEESRKAYRRTLESAIAKRIQNQDRVGIIFSGGIDSLLVAQISKRLGANITCYSAGHADSSDLFHAVNMARGLNMELRPVSLEENAVMGLIPDVINVIEDRSIGQVEVAIPIFAAVRAAQKEGQIVLLTGQAADELFGGYPWYRHIIEGEGYDQFQFRMQDDLLHLYKETLEREDKITMAHSIELRVPYLDPEVIHTAMSIAPELKVFGGDDVLGKHVHRELAVEMGIPYDWAMRPKEAAQHGAGVHDLLDGLARSNGFGPDVAERVGYSAEDNTGEQLGSSARYGYRYGDREMWEPQDHVQLFLDWVAYENDLLTESERDRVGEFVEEALT